MRIPRTFLKKWLEAGYSLSLLRAYLLIRTVSSESAGYTHTVSLAAQLSLSRPFISSTLTALTKLGLAVKLGHGRYKIISLYRLMAEARESSQCYRVDLYALKDLESFKAFIYSTKVEQFFSKNDVRSRSESRYANCLAQQDLKWSENTVRKAQRKAHELALIVRTPIFKQPPSSEIHKWQDQDANRCGIRHSSIKWHYGFNLSVKKTLSPTTNFYRYFDKTTLSFDGMEKLFPSRHYVFSY